MDTAKKVLTDNYAYLVEHMKADDVLPKLVTARLVGQKFHQEIENRTATNKVQTLLTEILRSPDPEWFVKFAKALSDTDENHKMIADKLLAGTEPTRPSSSSSSFSGNTTAAHLSTMEQEMSLQQPTLRTCTHKSTIIKLPPMPVELQVITSVFHNNKVYITGISMDHVPESRRVHVYSLEGNTWSTLPESNHNAPIAIINDHITLIGGRDAKTNALTNIMYSWCEEEGEWRQILPLMPTKLRAGRAYQHGNLVLVTGGGTGEEDKVTDKVHIFNFSTMKWTTPQSLQLPRGLRSHYLIHFEGYIYLMGGALTFQPEEGLEEIRNANAWRARWSDIKEAAQQNAGMQHSLQGKSVWTPVVAPPTLCPTVVMFSNAILSVGGISDGKSLGTIYKLVDHDTDSPSWIEMGSMRVGRYRHAVAPLGNLGAALFVAGGFMWVRNDEAKLKSASVELVLL